MVEGGPNFFLLRVWEFLLFPFPFWVGVFFWMGLEKRSFFKGFASLSLYRWSFGLQGIGKFIIAGRWVFIWP